jgi:hypothetical protein
VKFVRRQPNHLVFQLGRREHQLLLDLLQLYPLTPTQHHRLSRTADPHAIQADQQLLEEAMASQKTAGHERLRAFLVNRHLLQPQRGGCQLTIPLDHTEWFLQVLNDIRVGSWLQLGCPDQSRNQPMNLTPASARLFLAIEFCGMFQSLLLDALDQDPGSSPHGAPT